MRAAAAIIGVVALLGLAAYAGQARAMADNAAPETPDTLDEGPGMIDTAAVAGGNPFAIMDRSTIEASQADTNCAAMLQAISHGEGTDRDGVDPYGVCFDYAHTVQDFAFHPCEGAKDGRASGPEWAGFTDKKGKWHSPAGRYQITLATWRGCKRALSLPDFGPDSQDKAALYLIRGRHAIELVQAGQFDAAVALLGNEWASMPSSTSGQPMARLADLRTTYTDAGGVLA